MSGAVKSAEGIVSIVVTDTALMTPNIAVPGHSETRKEQTDGQRKTANQNNCNFLDFPLTFDFMI